MTTIDIEIRCREIHSIDAMDLADQSIEEWIECNLDILSLIEWEVV
mgnify:CR=1 FL=1|jgi:hypothetical protein|tara:strand:+ start:2566 stop:2703 length:138 start_codon:yes stop_codon:yes gene_type:complete